MGDQPRFNKICAFADCDSWTASIFCKPHYMSLPQHIRYGLWSEDRDVIAATLKAAKQWLADKRDNALIVKEEGP